MAIIKLSPGIESAEFYNKQTESDVAMNIMADIESVLPYFVETWAKAYRNVKFYANDQWTAAERMAFARQKRIAYVWNEIAPQINNMLGQQQQTRMDVKLSAVEQGDEMFASVGNRLIKWFEQVNVIDTIQSEVFKMALLQGASVTQIRWEFSDFLSGYPLVERVPLYQMLWDLNGTDVTMDDCRWMARVIPMRKAEAMERFPEYAKMINKQGYASGSLYPLLTAAMEPLKNIRQYSYYNISNAARDYVYILMHTEQLMRHRFIVIDEAMGTPMQAFDTEKEADDYRVGLVSSYNVSGVPVMNNRGEDLVSMYRTDERTYRQTVLINNDVAECAEVELPSHPFQVNYANYVDGDFWSYVDGLIPAQRFLNRMVSEWDNQVSRSAKNLVEVVPHQLHGQWTLEDLRDEWAKVNPIIPVKKLNTAIFPHANPSASSDFPNLLGRTNDFLSRMGGGQNIMGLAENAAESSKTVRARQAAAGLGRVPLFTYLEMWRKNVTEHALWSMKNFIEPKFLRSIIGNDPDIVNAEIDDTDVLDTIHALRTNLNVKSVPDTDIAREQIRNDFMEIIQMTQGQVPYQVWMPMLLEVSDIPADQKQKLMGMLDFYQKYEQDQQQQAAQGKVQEQAERAVAGEQLRDSMRAEVAQGQASPTQIQQQVGA